MELSEEGQRGYARWRDLNSGDGYSLCVVRFAEAWAEEMERAMSDGKPLEAIAETASRIADEKFGITGFMYGCAVGALATFWKYGEALRKWHNLKTQIGKEGEKANETGGVLNPALLSIG